MQSSSCYLPAESGRHHFPSTDVWQSTVLPTKKAHQASESIAFTGAPSFKPGRPPTGLTFLQLLQRLAYNCAMQSPHPKSHCWCDSKPPGKPRKLPSSMTSKGLEVSPEKLREKARLSLDKAEFFTHILPLIPAVSLHWAPSVCVFSVIHSHTRMPDTLSVSPTELFLPNIIFFPFDWVIWPRTAMRDLKCKHSSFNSLIRIFSL